MQTTDIAGYDIVKRGIKRDLPCKLNDDEFTRIAKTRATKEAERDELEADLKREKQRREAQIEELEDEIGKMGRELRTGEQDRIVTCDEVFVRDFVDGSGWVVTIRRDTMAEVERRPASAHETQRYLPNVEAPEKGGLIEQASAAQVKAERSAGGEAPATDTDDVPPASDEDEDEDDEETETPSKKRKAKKT